MEEEITIRYYSGSMDEEHAKADSHLRYPDVLKKRYHWLCFDYGEKTKATIFYGVVAPIEIEGKYYAPTNCVRLMTVCGIRARSWSKPHIEKFSIRKMDNIFKYGHQ